MITLDLIGDSFADFYFVFLFLFACFFSRFSLFQKDPREFRLLNLSTPWKFSNLLKDFKGLFWTPGCGWQGSMNQGLSVLLSRNFLGTGSLVFCETQHVASDPCVVVGDRAGFFEKNIFAPKMEKVGQKRVKNRVIKIYWKM